MIIKQLIGAILMAVVAFSQVQIVDASEEEDAVRLRLPERWQAVQRLPMSEPVKSTKQNILSDTRFEALNLIEAVNLRSFGVFSAVGWRRPAINMIYSAQKKCLLTSDSIENVEMLEWSPMDRAAFPIMQVILEEIKNRMMSKGYPMSAAVIQQLRSELSQDRPNAKCLCLMRYWLKDLSDWKMSEDSSSLPCIRNARSLLLKDLDSLIEMANAIAWLYLDFYKQITAAKGLSSQTTNVERAPSPPANTTNVYSLEMNWEKCLDHLSQCLRALRPLIDKAVQNLETEG